jgi:hypothetical protein
MDDPCMDDHYNGLFHRYIHRYTPSLISSPLGSIAEEEVRYV